MVCPFPFVHQLVFGGFWGARLQAALEKALKREIKKSWKDRIKAVVSSFY